MRRRLNENADYVKGALRTAGFEISQAPGPVIPVYTESGRESEALKKHLLAAGIFPPFVKYPGGDANGYFRFVISSEHSRAQLDRLIKALKRC